FSRRNAAVAHAHEEALRSRDSIARWTVRTTGTATSKMLSSPTSQRSAPREARPGKERNELHQHLQCLFSDLVAPAGDEPYHLLGVDGGGRAKADQGERAGDVRISDVVRIHATAEPSDHPDDRGEGEKHRGDDRRRPATAVRATRATVQALQRRWLQTALVG